MEDYTEYPKGRAPAVFLLALFFGITVVLALSCWFSYGGLVRVSLTPLYIWEIALFMMSIISFVIFIILRNNMNHVREHSPTQTENVNDSDYSYTSKAIKTKLPWWSYFPLRTFAFIICTVGSIVFPVFEIYRALDNLSCFDDKSKELSTALLLKLLGNILQVVFCLFQIVVLLLFKHKMSGSRPTKLLLSPVIAANMTLCLNVVLNVVSTSNTIELFYRIHPVHDTNITIQFNVSSAQLVNEAIYLKCDNGTANVDETALFFHKYLHQFPIEFVVIALDFLWRVWNITSPSPTSFTCVTDSENDHSLRHASVASRYSGPFQQGFSFTSSTSDGEDSECRGLVQHSKPGSGQLLKQAVKSTLIFVSQQAAIPTTVYVIMALILQVDMDIRNAKADNKNLALSYYYGNRTLSGVVEWYSTLQTVYAYVFCIVAFIGYILARKQKELNRNICHSDVLFLIGATGHFTLTLFETFDSIEQFSNRPAKDLSEKIFFLIKGIFYYVGLYSQTLLVMKISKIKVLQKSMKDGRQLVIKGIVVFIGICNAKSWATDSFLAPEVLTDVDGVENLDVYGQTVWWFLTEFLYPLVVVYRLLSAIMCFEACVRFKRECSRASVDKDSAE